MQYFRIFWGAIRQAKIRDLTKALEQSRNVSFMLDEGFVKNQSL